MIKFDWPLATSPFTFTDRAKIAWQILSQDRYTMGEKVAELEKKFTTLSNGSKALMVANGSVANQLVFELWKIKNPNIKPVVIVPAVTWVSSITPAMMADMHIVFCDINLEDFSFNYNNLEDIVSIYAQIGRKIIIWPTALIGWAPDMARLSKIAKLYKADLFLDACENTLSSAPILNENEELSCGQILNSADITTTSCYLSHYVCSVEGGFVFFKNQDDYDLAKMFRNHGMVRSLSPDHPLRKKIQKENPTIDQQFLFALAGTNLRPSDVHAMFGLEDFKRVDKMKKHRINIYRSFFENLDNKKYYLPDPTNHHVPFCLPIFVYADEKINFIKTLLKHHGIETRPIIGSNLLHQPPFKKYGKPEDYTNAEWIHTHGAYVGLHHNVTQKMVKNLTDILNQL